MVAKHDKYVKTPDQVYYEDIESGFELKPKDRGPITITDLVMFAGASGDYSPIHHDRDYAKNVAGLPDIILFGQCKLAFIANLVTDWIGLEGRIKSIGAQYRGMDILGDRIISKGRVKSKFIDGSEYLVELELWNENSRSGTTASGNAIVSIPSRGI